ncbi:glutamyl-tRNA synthetase [Lophium mytilinum]|uniref:Glutamate--tRNA ligase, mitochondrial n=1 Tax=Lophium mytilinum TaxID=390894 RepID=A0A6A6RC59_9PEZI|nr:glutamyl-tRNA synthetase [Lophium mytilinum]
MFNYLARQSRPGAFTCAACLARLSRVSKRTNSTSGFESRLRIPKSPRKLELPSSPARTRFAPSPTGYLHLGSLRTALYNYLLAKRTGGQFLLRIEDTDQKRTVPGAEKRLLEDLRWAGLEWDEGPEVGGPYGPYKQSERTTLYQEHAEKLVSSGHAYRCFCTSQRLAEMAKLRTEQGLSPDYDRTCAGISEEESQERAAKGESHVVRLKVPDVYPEFNDLVYKKVGHTKRIGANDGYEDPVLLKSDGLPTYHLANVVDDHHMKITHVIRGTEWLPATPKHLVMYQAFGWSPPEFAHVGLLVDEKGNKLSKRNFDTDIASYRDKLGVFPEALSNFVALLGWSHKNKTDVMTMNELVDNFVMKFTKGNSTVTLGKLWFLQQKHAIRRIDAGGPPFDKMVDDVVAIVEKDLDPAKYEVILGSKNLREYVASIVRSAARKDWSTPKTFVEQCDYFFNLPEPASSHENVALSLPFIQALKKLPQELPWDSEPVKDAIKAGMAEWCATNSKSEKEGYQFLRGLVANGKHGPGVHDIMTILGREETFRRLGEEALEKQVSSET